MKKQTAVWYLICITDTMIQNGGDLGEDYPALKKNLEQALAMEREQIEEAFEDGWNDNAENHNTTLQKYYKRKFNYS